MLIGKIDVGFDTFFKLSENPKLKGHSWKLEKKTKMLPFCNYFEM